MLELFRQDNTASALFGAVKHQAIPVWNRMQPVEVDSGEDIAGNRLNQIEARVGLYLLPGERGVRSELPRGVDEIFL